MVQPDQSLAPGHPTGGATLGQAGSGSAHAPRDRVKPRAAGAGGTWEVLAPLTLAHGESGAGKRLDINPGRASHTPSTHPCGLPGLQPTLQPFTQRRRGHSTGGLGWPGQRLAGALLVAGRDRRRPPLANRCLFTWRRRWKCADRVRRQRRGSGPERTGFGGKHLPGPSQSGDGGGQAARRASGAPSSGSRYGPPAPGTALTLPRQAAAAGRVGAATEPGFSGSCQQCQPRQPPGPAAP